MSKIIIGHATVCRACNNGAPFRYGAHTINRQEFRLTEFAALREAVADESICLWQNVRRQIPLSSASSSIRTVMASLRVELMHTQRI